jgi:tetratricopeptide (TPR) repeat protein
MTGKQSSSDYSLKMGKALLVIIVSCAVVFSTSQWIIKPYIVSKNIQSTALLIKKGQGAEAYDLLKKTLSFNTFFQEDIIMPVKRFLKASVNNIESAENKKMVNLLLKESYKITEKHPLRYRLLLVQADLEAMSADWDKQALAKAEITAEKVIGLAPNFPNSHLLMSKILFLENKIERAMEEAEKTIELNPNLPEPYFILSLAHRGLGNKEKQLEELEKAVKLGVRFTDKESVLGAVNIFLEEKRYDIIEILYKQAIQLDPQDVTLYASLATTYAKLHNKEKAIEYARKAVEMDQEGYKEASQIFIQWVENEQWDKIPD